MAYRLHRLYQETKIEVTGADARDECYAQATSMELNVSVVQAMVEQW
jgi:hypothetical protein